MKKISYIIISLFFISCNSKDVKTIENNSSTIEKNSLEESKSNYDEEDLYDYKPDEIYKKTFSDFINEFVSVERIDSIYFDLKQSSGLCGVDTSLYHPFMIRGEKAMSMLNTTGKIMNDSTRPYQSIVATLYTDNGEIQMDIWGTDSFTYNNKTFEYSCADVFFFYRNDKWTTIKWDKRVPLN